MSTEITLADIRQWLETHLQEAKIELAELQADNLDPSQFDDLFEEEVTQKGLTDANFSYIRIKLQKIIQYEAVLKSLSRKEFVEVSTFFQGEINTWEKLKPTWENLQVAMIECFGGDTSSTNIARERIAREQAIYKIFITLLASQN